MYLGNSLWKAILDLCFSYYLSLHTGEYLTWDCSNRTKTNEKLMIGFNINPVTKFDKEIEINNCEK